MSDTTIRRPLRWISAEESNVGMVRVVNEDSVISIPEIQLWAVADGMGGYEAGDVASNMIVKSLSQLESKSTLNEFIDSIEDSLLDVNHRILEYADIMLDGRTLGSTVVALGIKDNVGVCLWAGDSRLYRLRNEELVQLSRDHSQVEELVQQGFLTPEAAQSHPDSNVITRAIGANLELYIDINIFSSQLSDTFLLCSDGLYNMLTKEEMRQILIQHPINKAVSTLIEKALDRGANDNVSVILINGELDAIMAP